MEMIFNGVKLTRIGIIQTFSFKLIFVKI